MYFDNFTRKNNIGWHCVNLCKSTCKLKNDNSIPNINILYTITPYIHQYMHICTYKLIKNKSLSIRRRILISCKVVNLIKIMATDVISWFTFSLHNFTLPAYCYHLCGVKFLIIDICRINNDWR